MIFGIHSFGLLWRYLKDSETVSFLRRGVRVRIVQIIVDESSGLIRGRVDAGWVDLAYSDLS